MPIQTIATEVIRIATMIATGAIGEVHDLDLQSRFNMYDETRGAFWHRFSERYEAPQFQIVGDGYAYFMRELQSGIVTGDGGRVRTAIFTSYEPYPIYTASRLNWSCNVPLGNGTTEVVRLRAVQTFRLLHTCTIAQSSPLISTLGGYCRMRIKFPGSRPAGSPCNGAFDLTGQNQGAAASPPLVPVTEAFYVKPSVMAGTSVISLSARYIIEPQLVNWDYWNAQLGFGPQIVHEAYTAPTADVM